MTEQTRLSVRLAQATRALHGRAEGSGIVAAMLDGSVTRGGYALYLRNLLPAYVALEAGLARHQASRLIGGFALAETARAAALVADLEALHGPSWPDLVVLPEARAYAAAVEDAAQGDGARLLAHAYTRVLGDLSGGQMLAMLLARTLGLGADALQFAHFPGIADLAAFKAAYRARLDELGALVERPERVVAAAILAFEHNISVSLAVAAAASAI